MSHNTRIKFLTDGMLLREAILDSTLKNYRVLILDEAHERTVNSDVLMALVKKIVYQRSEEKDKRKHLKLIVMSATLELEKFMGYFGASMDQVAVVEGRTHQI